MGKDARSVRRLQRMFSNRYVISIGIPFILLLAGSVAKKLVRGSGWKREDFYLGVEFSLSALSSTLIYAVQLSSVARSSSSSELTNPGSTGVFSIICFVILLVVLSLHQDWDVAERRGRAQFLILVVFCNFLGMGLLATFSLMIKGVYP